MHVPQQEQSVLYRQKRRDRSHRSACCRAREFCQGNLSRGRRDLGQVDSSRLGWSRLDRSRLGYEVDSISTPRGPRFVISCPEFGLWSPFAALYKGGRAVAKCHNFISGGACEWKEYLRWSQSAQVCDIVCARIVHA
jgi:hypothetical protein